MTDDCFSFLQWPTIFHFHSPNELLHYSLHLMMMLIIIMIIIIAFNRCHFVHLSMWMSVFFTLSVCQCSWTQSVVQINVLNNRFLHWDVHEITIYSWEVWTSAAATNYYYYYYRFICQLFPQLITLIILFMKHQKQIVKKAHHSFPEFRMTSSCFLCCPTSRQKPKEEKQILTFKKLELILILVLSVDWSVDGCSATTETWPHLRLQAAIII